MNNKIKSKCAFTLAEILITPVIIGIVAALTISAVINTYVERSTISKVKKGLSTLAQAKKLAEFQDGPIQSWNFEKSWTKEAAANFFSYIKPYLSLAKDCGASTDCYQNNGVKYLNNTTSFNYNTDDRYYKFVLADGGVMWFAIYPGGCNSSSKGCADFIYDINGSKKPNTEGRDIFHYTMSINGVSPVNSDTCNKNSQGWGCAGYIIRNNNMNYLH